MRNQHYAEQNDVACVSAILAQTNRVDEKCSDNSNFSYESV